MNDSSTYLKRAEKYNGTHRALAEELLQPNTNHNDMNRTQMFTSHFVQSVVLNNPELPKVFTNFENHIGKYSSAVKKLPQDAKVIAMFNYSIYKCYLLLEYADGSIDIHVTEPVKHLTEKFGYIYNNSFLDGVTEGDELEEGATIRSWPCSDENENLRYGTNLKTVYQFFKGQTYEDAIVISESAAEKLKHTSVTKVDVMLNNNDILINTLGDRATYKSFPDIGEDIKDGILTARRRIEHASIINNLTDSNLNKIFFESDTIFYSKGKVVDIEIFNNNNVDVIDNLKVFNQIKHYYVKQFKLTQWLIDNMPDIKENPEKYSSECAFLYRRYVEEDLNWEYNDSQFDGTLIRFTIATESPIVVGSKLTNRHGGKGVVGRILPDEEMPTTVDGEVADVVCNAGGISSRMNLAQLYEQELNHAANIIHKRMKSDIENAEVIYRDFIDFVTPDSFSEFLDTMKEEYPDEYQEYIDEILETGFIQIHQPPMYDNIGLSGLREMYQRFNIEKIALQNVENPVIFGDIYYMKLRHEPAGKHSARSASHLSITGLPAKNNRNFKAGTEHHSSTAIRLG